MSRVLVCSDRDAVRRAYRGVRETPDCVVCGGPFVSSSEWMLRHWSGPDLEPTHERCCPCWTEPRGVTEVDEQAPVQQGPDKP